MEKTDEFETAFKRIYCFDSKSLEEARSLHLEGRIEDAKHQYNHCIDAYEQELARILNIEPKSSVTFVSPLCILEESRYEAGLKQKTNIEELAAKIYLAKAMMEEIEQKDPKDNLEKSEKHYKELGDTLTSLAGTCSPYEDVAELMFRCEAKSAYKVSESIREKLTGEILRVNDFKVLDWYTYSSLFSNGKIGCPKVFAGKIKGKKDLEKIVDIVAEKIKTSELPQYIRSPVFESLSLGGDRCVISSAAYDSKNDVVGFVLLQEIGLVGGMSWKEGCYGIRIDEDKIKGALLKFNRGFYTHTWIGGEESENEGSRLVVHGIKNGILKYSHVSKYAPKPKGCWDLEYNLKELQNGTRR